jgi:hypothetical protein
MWLAKARLIRNVDRAERANRVGRIGEIEGNIAGELPLEPGVDATKIGVVSAAVGAEDRFVPLSNDDKPAVFSAAHWTLELHGSHWMEDEPALRDRAAIELDVCDRPKWPVVLKPQAIYLPWPREDVPRTGFSNASRAMGHYLDRKVSDAHELLQESGLVG